MNRGIREVHLEKNQSGNYKRLQVFFGPHYFLELMTNDQGEVAFVLGATHHGFKVDASEVNGELEKIIYEIRQSHPETAID